MVNHLNLLTYHNYRNVLKLPVKIEARALRPWTKCSKIGVDALHALPLEICQNIAQHLDIPEIFPAQRVSKHWLRTFGSSELVWPLLKTRFHEWNDILASPVIEDLSGAAFAARKAEQLTAYRTGRAFSMRHGTWSLGSSVRDARGFSPIAYFGGLLAWITEENDVRLLDLESGKEKRFVSKRHSARMEHIGVSSSLVAAVNDLEHSTCHIWELDCEKTYTLALPRLPSIRQLSVAQKTVVVSHENPYVNLSEIGFTVWRLGFGASVEIRSRLDEWLHINRLSIKGAVVMLNPAGDTIYHFTEAEHTDGFAFRFISLSITGEIKKTSFLRMPAPSNKLAEVSISVPTDGQFVVWTYVSIEDVIPRKIGSVMPQTNLHITSVVYKPLSDNFCFKKAMIPTQYAYGPGEFMDSVMGFSETQEYGIFFWKDVCYYLTRRYVNNSVHSVLKVIDFAKLASMDAPMHGPPDPEPLEYGDGQKRGNYKYGKAIAWDASIFRGDDKFLIHYNQWAFRVWCFEKNVSMVGEDPYHKEYMARAREIRLILKG